jgi:signal transduction histidine kinase
MQHPQLTPVNAGAETAPAGISNGAAGWQRLAHDLNNLLGIIIGNAELMLDQPSLDPKARRRVGSIYEAGIGARDAIAEAHALLPPEE